MRNSKKEKNWSDGKRTEQLDILKKNKETARGFFGCLSNRGSAGVVLNG
jgi:hypothetical protein